MSLISDLESSASTPKKTAFQTYTVKHGIEAMHVTIPLSVSVAFEEAMRLPQLSKQRILETVRQFGGDIK